MSTGDSPEGLQPSTLSGHGASGVAIIDFRTKMVLNWLQKSLVMANKIRFVYIMVVNGNKVSSILQVKPEIFRCNNQYPITKHAVGSF